MLAIALAVLSVARVSTSNGHVALVYRHGEKWQSVESLLVTEQGFPWGSAIQSYTHVGTTPNTPAAPIGDSVRLTNLANLYAYLANGDAVRHLVLQQGRYISGKATASLATPSDGSVPTLPLIQITGIAMTRQDAITITRRKANALLAYLKRQQVDAGIPAKHRVVVAVLSRASKAKVVAGRKKTVPVLVFMSVMVVTFGLAFVLQNVRPVRERSSSRPGLLTRLARHTS